MNKDEKMTIEEMEKIINEHCLAEFVFNKSEINALKNRNDRLEMEQKIYERKLVKSNQEILKDFAKIVISAIWAEKENEKIKIKDVHDTIRDILRMNFGIELE